MKENKKLNRELNQNRKKRFLGLLLLLLMPVLYDSCNNEEKEGEGPKVESTYITEIAAPMNGSTYKLGEKVPINVKINDAKQFREITIWIDSKKVLNSAEAKKEFTFDYSTDSTGVGMHTVRVETKRADEVMEPIEYSFLVLSNEKPIDYHYKVMATLPHQADCFTQGLFIDKGLMYEGTGQYNHSQLRLLDFQQNKVLQSINVGDQYFGEGIALVGDKIYELTYKEHKVLVYDKKTFTLLKQFTYPTEGWGLTYDGKYLIMTDGSENLFYYEPENFTLVKKVQVADDLSTIKMLNELEYINGEIWANVWQTNWVLQIDPKSGKVISRIDCTGLLPQNESASADVLNGIAYDNETGKIYLTGKYWPHIYQIERVK